MALWRLVTEAFEGDKSCDLLSLISLLSSFFLLFSFALQLVILYSFILIDPIHQLMYIGGRLASQRLPQVMLGWEAILEGVDGDVVKVAIHLIIHLPISARVSL